MPFVDWISSQMTQNVYIFSSHKIYMYFQIRGYFGKLPSYMIKIYNEIWSLEKRSGVVSSECFKNYEIPTYVTDKNTKFTTKSVHIVTCGLFQIFTYI